jgi:hypothetical protein
VIQSVRIFHADETIVVTNPNEPDTYVLTDKGRQELKTDSKIAEQIDRLQRGGKIKFDGPVIEVD